MSTPVDLTGQRILITGATGSVATPVAMALAKDNEVFAGARFSSAKAKAKLEAAGISTVYLDLETPDLSNVPDGLDYVLHFAVAKTNDADRDLAANAEGTAFLIEKVKGVKAFFHCSSTAVYAPKDHEPRVETDQLGDSHAAFGFMPTYSIAKIAAESAAKYAARRFEVPTVIARLNVPYGENYGWMFFHLLMMQNGTVPVHENGPTQYNPIHHDDIVASLPYLLGAAAVPAPIFNWGGTEIVSIEEWTTEIGRLIGLTPTFAPTTATLETVIGDTSKLQALGFQPSVHWKDGIRRLVSTMRPDLLVES